MTLGAHTLRPRHWGFAFVIALLLHAALALLLFQPAAPGALAGGRSGIQVGLGPAGGAASAPSDVQPEENSGVEEPLPEAQEALPPQAETLPPETVQEAAPAPPPAAPAEVPLYALVEEVEAEAPPVEAEAVAEVPAEEPPVEEAPLAEVPPKETVAQAAMPTPPKPRAKPKLPVVERQAAEAAAEPEVAEVRAPAPQPVPDSSQTAARDLGQTTTAPAKGTPGAVVSGTRGKAGIGDTAAAGTARSAGAGGNPGAYVDYKQLIMSWLQQHKAYPRRAKLRRQEGEAFVFIAIDSNGKLLDYRLDKSSGHRLLDEEVTAMLERAQPLPAAQSGTDIARYEFRFRVDFWLQ